MSEELFAHMVGNVGVPGLLCFYVLFVLNKNVAKLNDTFSQWCRLIEQRIERLENEVHAARRS